MINSQVLSSSLSISNKQNQTVSFKIFTPTKSNSHKSNRVIQSIEMFQSEIINVKSNYNENGEQMISVLKDFEEFIGQVQSHQLLDKLKIQEKQNQVSMFYQKQKCRLDHKFHYISIILQQRRNELEEIIKLEQLETQQRFEQIIESIDSFSKLLQEIRSDIQFNQNNIIEQLSWNTFQEIILNYNEQIIQLQDFNQDIIRIPLNLIAIQELNFQQQEEIGNLIKLLIDYQKYTHKSNTQSEKHSLNLGDTSSKDEQSGNFYLAGSDIQDSCDDELLSELQDQKLF